ncbi:uncharacterized, partial [Tachysurus ichikawai]
ETTSANRANSNSPRGKGDETRAEADVKANMYRMNASEDGQKMKKWKKAIASCTAFSVKK